MPHSNSLLAMGAAMCFSTIWCRYHYVADIFGGIVTGTLGYWIGGWLMRKNGAVSASANASRRFVRVRA
jgi:membrane-associated phospholipid phosphatase